MRVIINSEFYKNIDLFDESETFAFIKITKLVGEKQSLILQANKQALIRVYKISEETIEKFILMDILSFDEKTVKVNDQYVKLFNKNAEYMQKSRAKKLQEVEETEKPVKVVKTSEISEHIDYKEVMNMFNDMTVDTPVPRIDIMNDDRKKQVKKFIDAGMKNFETNDYKKLLKVFFKLLKDDPKEYIKGWPDNRVTPAGWFQPTFKQIMKNELLVGLYEKSQQRKSQQTY